MNCKKGPKLSGQLQKKLGKTGQNFKFIPHDAEVLSSKKDEFQHPLSSGGEKTGVSQNFSIGNPAKPTSLLESEQVVFGDEG